MSKKLTFYILIIYLTFSLVNTQTCTNSKTHIASGLTDAQKQKILDKHNELRNRVASGSETTGAQPAATNMRKMQWDDTVATNAQTHSSKCVFEHSASGDRPDSGENLAWSTYNTDVSDERILQLVQLWYDEVSLFNKDHISPYQFNSGTGHYTQVIWANSYKLGCGLTKYQGTNKEVILTCQYSPAGNYLNQAIYEAGNSCSNCASGLQCDTTYSSLCKDPNASYTIGGSGDSGSDGGSDNNGSDGGSDNNGSSDGENADGSDDGEQGSQSSQSIMLQISLFSILLISMLL